MPITDYPIVVVELPLFGTFFVFARDAVARIGIEMTIGDEPPTPRAFRSVVVAEIVYPTVVGNPVPSVVKIVHAGMMAEHIPGSQNSSVPEFYRFGDRDVV
jgi:hypothetical protein